MKNCKYCNKEFQPKSNKAVFCSTNCRIKAHQKKNNKAVDTNTEIIQRFVPNTIKCDLCGKQKSKWDMGSQSFRYEKTGEVITILICHQHFTSNGLSEETVEKARELAIVRGSKGTAKFKEGGLVYIP